MANRESNSRERLTAADFDFVADAVTEKTGHHPSALMTSLLTDPEMRDAALDSDRLLKSVLESPATIGVTPQLYFYVLVRRVLGQLDREVADHVAGVLASFVKKEGTPVPYISDMLIALQSASTDREFAMRVQIGNCSLFLSGIFPQFIRERATRRGAPAIGFYDEVGSMNYRLAANHRLAQQNERADVYRTMADHFTEVRVGLNQLADRLLCLESPA